MSVCVRTVQANELEALHARAMEAESALQAAQATNRKLAAVNEELSAHLTDTSQDAERVRNCVLLL